MTVEPLSPGNVSPDSNRLASTWSPKAPLPAPIAEVGVGQVADKIYVVGGTDQQDHAVATTMRYDPALDSWETCHPLPQALHHVAVAELDGLLYAIGGLAANVHIAPQRVVFAYDPKVDRWSEVAPMSIERGSVAAVAFAGKIHVFGGRVSEKVVKMSPPNTPEMLLGIGTVTKHEVYDPAADRWSSSEPLPGPPRDHMGVAVLGDAIHVFGGRINDYSDMLDRHDVFVPRTKTWASAAPLPRPRSAGAFTVLHDRIIYAGGECKPGGEPFTANAFEDVDSYDPSTDTWSALTPLPQGRHAFGAATVDGVAYFAGGALLCGGGASTDLLALTVG